MGGWDVQVCAAGAGGVGSVGGFGFGGFLLARCGVRRGLFGHCFLDVRRHSHPGECSQLSHPTSAHEPGEDVHVCWLVVFAGDEG